MDSTVRPNTVVTLEYHVTNPDGELVDEGRTPIVYLHGGFDDIFPRIEEALNDKRVGDSVVVKLQPEEAFGEYDAEMVQMEPRDSFPKELTVGMQFEGGAPDSDPDELTLYRVTDITDEQVILDGNHPLAGMALVFTCTVSGLRPASKEEIKAGSAHDADDDEDDEA